MTLMEHDMTLVQLASIVFGAVTLLAVGFQLALAGGAPWGDYAMGGKLPGRWPAPMRLAALLQALMLGAMATLVLNRAHHAALGWPRPQAWLIWVIVGVCALSLVMNLITPSAPERRLWAPVAALMLATSLTVALLG